MYCDNLASYSNFCFDVCCLQETIYVSADRFSSPHLKRLPRLKEKAFKEKDGTSVKALTGRIKEELHGPNKVYVQSVLGNGSCRELWRMLKTLSGYSRFVLL
ncbi:unnamed protein product [Dicrocoelium dendriticum]|nr:unnamed protein product [Dicrocoelium dendriticum]